MGRYESGTGDKMAFFFFSNMRRNSSLRGELVVMWHSLCMSVIEKDTQKPLYLTS